MVPSSFQVRVVDNRSFVLTLAPPVTLLITHPCFPVCCVQTRLATNNLARPNHKPAELPSTIEECDETEAPSPAPAPVSAKLSAGGVSVVYQVPGPPLIPPAPAPSGRHTDSDTDPEEFSEFLARVRSCGGPGPGDSLKRSDTSSATLPVTWSSSSLDRKFGDSSEESPATESRESLLTSGSPAQLRQVRGPVALLGDNFEPQVMTEECAALACPREYSGSPSTSCAGSSSSGSVFYATFIPDSCVREEMQGDEVSIVCNEFTRIETDSHATTDTTDTGADSDAAVISCSAAAPREQKTWTSTIRLPSLLDFWERRNKESQFKKYASESNICKNEELPENGLRKIPRDKNFTSCEDSFNEESDYSVRSGYEDHIYEEVALVSYRRQNTHGPEESGFFSYENPSLYRSDTNGIGEETSNTEDDIAEYTLNDVEEISSSDRENNVTIIAVDYSNTTNKLNNNNSTCPDRNQVIVPSASVKDLRKIFERDEPSQVSFVE